MCNIITYYRYANTYKSARIHYGEWIFSLFLRLPLLESSLPTYPVFPSSSNFSTEENPKREDYFGITNLVEHPAQLNPPGNRLLNQSSRELLYNRNLCGSGRVLYVSCLYSSRYPHMTIKT